MFRKILFWSHLVAGLISGIAVGIMCFTGTALAFEKQLIAWADRDARRAEPPTQGASPLTLEQLQAKLREAQPEARPASIVIQNDPHVAVGFGTGGRTGGGYYVDPYTGEVRASQNTSMGRFMASMITWHRYLGFSGEVSRPRGKWINGVCNIAFCVLAITGLYLWMPRNWSWRGVKAIAIFNWRLIGKARDFNWHNSIGLWSAPILIVLTLTAVPISFQWGARVINYLTGTPQPGAGQPAPAPAALPPLTITPPAPGTPVLSQTALIAAVQKELPTWETITINTAAGRGGRGGGPAPAGGRGGGGGRGQGAPAAANPPAPAPAPAAAPSGAPAVAPTSATAVAAPATFSVRLSDAYPRTSAVSLTLNPYTGEVLRRTGYADQAPAQRVRAWTRYLHTGEALGLWGQLVAGLACLGGCFLVYTGFALSYRRFFGKRAKPSEPTTTAANS